MKSFLKRTKVNKSEQKWTYKFFKKDCKNNQGHINQSKSKISCLVFLSSLRPYWPLSPLAIELKNILLFAVLH